MLVIQHRANDLTNLVTSDVAEIDVHIDEHGDIVVKHDPDDCGWELDEYLVASKHKKFFVDIKQNLCVEYYEKIIEDFGDKLIGIFDLPFPSAYFAFKAGIEFYGRLSEYELAPLRLTNRYWIDPLESWDDRTYRLLLYSVRHDAKAIIACPSLHGQNIEACKQVWRWMKNSRARDRIEGVVTKHTEEFTEVFDGE